MKSLIRGFLLAAVVASTLAVVSIGTASASSAAGDQVETAASTGVETLVVDSDGDGVADPDDACPDVPGPVDGARPGCPTLQRTVTMTSTNVGITGQVSVVPGPNTAPGTCQPTIVEVFDVRNDTTRELILRAQTDQTGRFTIEVPGFQEGKSYQVAAQAFLNRDVAFCAAAESAVLQIPLADRDGDGVADPADLCPDVAGPENGAYPGCPTLQRTVTATSAGPVITGQVSVTPGPNTAPGTCQPTTVGLFEVNNTDRALIGTALTDATGAYAITVPGPQAGKRYQIVARAFLDPNVAFCAAAESAVLQIPLADRDGDGVADPADLCPDVAGPENGAYPGCPTLQRTVTATSAGPVITGQVSVTPGPNTAPGTCQPTTVGLFEVNNTDRALIGTALTDATGAYAITVPGPQAGKRYQIVARAFLDPNVAFCAAAESAVLQLVDRDGDGVADPADLCPDVAGPENGAYPGCPTLQRTVTATSAGPVITGQVSVTPGPNTAPGTCQPTTVGLFEVNNTDRALIGTALTDATGAYAITVPGPQAGGRYVVAVKAFLDPNVAFCAAAESAVLQIPLADRDGDGVADPADLCPDVRGSATGVLAGCPTFGRSVDVSYKSGKVFGTVSSADQVTVGSKSTAPCADARVTVWMRDSAGVVTQLGSATTSSGPKSDFKLAVGNLRFGNTIWAVAEASSAVPLAYCLSAVSPPRFVTG